MTVPNTPIVNAGSLYINGLNLVYQGGANSIINLQPGQARDSLNINDILLPQALDSNGDPVVDQYGQPVGAIISGLVVGANGVDLEPFSTSDPASYGVFVIGDSTAYKPSAGLLSRNEATPVLPEGYDMYRRVGYLINPASSLDIAQWYQYGSADTRIYYYDVPFLQTVPTLSTSYTVWNFISPPFVDQLILDVKFTPAAASDTLEFLPYGSPAAAANPSTARGCVVFGGGVMSAALEAPVSVPVTPQKNMSGFLYPTALFKVSNTSDVLVVYVSGFVDLLV